MIIVIDISNAFHKSYFIAQHIYKDKLNAKLLFDKFFIDFFSSLRFIQKYYTITKVICCFDAANNYRKKINKEYKSNRIPKEQFFYDALDSVRLKLIELGFIVSKVDTFEADDLIGYWVSITQNEKICIFSNDEDIRQLISENIIVFNNQSHDKVFYTLINVQLNINDKKVKQKIIDPNWILFKKIFLGDSGDAVQKLFNGRIGEKLLMNKIFKKIIFKNHTCCIHNFCKIIDLIHKEFKNEKILIDNVVSNWKLVSLCNLHLTLEKEHYSFLESSIQHNYTYNGTFEYI